MPLPRQDDSARREDRRLSALRAYGVLDTPPEHAFDHLSRLVAEVFATPTALVTLVDEDRQWFKSRHGFEMPETPRDVAFCACTIEQRDVLVVPDARVDPRFATNPLVTGAPGVRFYAGAPLVTPSGEALGSLCVIDYVPRQVTEEQLDALRTAAQQVMKELELRRSLRELTEAVTGRRPGATSELLQEVLDRAPSSIAIRDLTGRYLLVNAEYARVVGLPAEDLVGRRGEDVLPAELAKRLEESASVCAATGQAQSLEVSHPHPDGDRCFAVSHFPLLDWAGHVYAVGTIAHDVSLQRRGEERLRFLAEHDPVTGLVNRQGFHAQLARVLADASEVGEQGRGPVGGTGLLVCDVDNFTIVNDMLGHQAGDAFLVTVARLLQGHLTEREVVARLEGDAFAVLLPDTEEARVREVAADLLCAVREHAPRIGSRPTRATLSIGGCILPPAARSTPEDLLAAADGAMYDAKDRGRDRAVVRTLTARSGDAVAVRRARVTWAERVKDALAADRFTLDAQPIVPLRGGEDVVQYELLLRMVDPTGARVKPASFLPVAEGFDLVQALDRWVARSAVHALDRLPSGTRFHVNLSAKSLRDDDLLTVLEAELEGSGVDPRRLTFEVTETAALVNLEESRAFAERLRGLGCGFALDDFGTGFSSFYYLKHLPVDVVKIDGDFVRELARSRVDEIVVRSVVGIAEELGLRTVAEFVEDATTAELLRSYGVHLGQGYHLGRPAPLVDLLPLTG